MDNQRLILISSENISFTIPKKVVYVSKLVSMMLDVDQDEDEIYLNVASHVLAKIVQFMIYHCDNPPKYIERPLKSTNLEDIIHPWDLEFINVDNGMLCELIIAANYMDIPPLLDLLCAKVALMTQNKTPEQIQEIFNIQTEFSDNEKKVLRDEIKWIDNFRHFYRHLF